MLSDNIQGRDVRPNNLTTSTDVPINGLLESIRRTSQNPTRPVASKISEDGSGTAAGEIGFKLLSSRSGFEIVIAVLPFDFAVNVAEAKIPGPLTPGPRPIKVSAVD